MTFLVAAVLLQAASLHAVAAPEEQKPAAVDQAAAYAGPVQRYAVLSQELTWFDSSRGRAVPVKVYYPAPKDQTFPVILFSTGLGRSREDCNYFGRYWAACGYISVFVQHKGSDDDVTQGVGRPRKQLRRAFDDPENIRDRPRDLIFALARLDQCQHERNALGRRLDMQRVGVSGHDFGAQTTLALAGQVLPGQVAIVEPRIKAVAAMSAPVPLGQVPLEVAYGDISIPCLHITGTNDDGIVGTTRASQRRLPFDYTAGADQYLVIFRGADHMVYSGHVLTQLNGRTDGMFQHYIARTSAAFWDAYLSDIPAARQWMIDGGLQTMLGGRAKVEDKIHR